MRIQVEDQRFQPVTNLLTNPGFEAAGSTVTVRTNLLTNPAPGSATGWNPYTNTTISYASGEITVTTAGVGAAEGVQTFTAADATARPNVSGGIWVNAPAGTLLWVGVYANGQSAGSARTNFTATGSYQYVTASNASSAVGGPGHTIMVHTQATTAVTFKVKQAVVELSSVAGPYFDGGYQASPDADLSTSWTGTANVSTSILTGVGIAGLASANGVAAIRSSRWAKTGTYSMRLIPTAPTSTDTWARFQIPVASQGIPLTAIATCHLEAPMTASAGSSARTLRGVLPDVRSASAPNVAGDTELRLTFTASAAPYELRFMHGGPVGSGDVWWDLAMLTPGSYQGRAFTGDSPYAKWNGTPNASTSTGYPYV